MIGDLVAADAGLRQQRGDDRVAGFVIRAVDAVHLAQDQRPALDAHQHFVARVRQVGVGDPRPLRPRGEERCLVDDVGEVGAREARRAARDGSEIDFGVDLHFPRVHAQDRFASLDVRVADRYLPVEAARPEQRGIEDVLAVRRRDHDDAELRFEAVHLDEQLVQRLLALFVAEGVAAAAAPDGVELVDEDDAGLVAARVLEQPPHARGADARVHLDEVRAAGEQERHTRLAGDGAREQRLAGSGRTDEQDALRDVTADGREAIRDTAGNRRFP